MLLNRQGILDALALKTEGVAVDDAGNTVRVSEMSAADRVRFQTEIADYKGDPAELDVAARFLARCIVDDAGARLFADDDHVALSKLPSTVIAKLFKVAERVNAIGAGAVEDVAKNS